MSETDEWDKDDWPQIQKEIDATDILVLRSEEHTSELQSLTNLVCRLLLEKKKKNFLSRIS